MHSCVLNSTTEFGCAIFTRVWHYGIVSVAMVLGSITMTWIWFFVFDWTRERRIANPKPLSRYTSLESFDFTFQTGRIALEEEFRYLDPKVGIITSGSYDFVANVKEFAIEKGHDIYYETFL
jgi:hypothetical protein